MISIVDYGLGNILAFKNIYKKLNIDCRVASSKDDLKDSKGIILPGVGSFDWAMTKLNNSGMREMLDNLVIHKKVPVIGICVGMQIMAKKSEEGNMDGLGWIDAEIKKFDQPQNNEKLQLPHMGWNDIRCQKKNVLLDGLENNAKFYFLHSYYFKESSQDQVLTVTNYGKSFTSCAFKDNIYAVQFHPEKSHEWGEKLLKNFAEIQNA